MRHHLNGKWAIEQIPQEYNRLMELMGYNRLERKYFKSAKPDFHTQLTEDDRELTLKVNTPIYNRVKTYQLNDSMVEYQDNRNHPVMEVARWIDPVTIEIKTMYPAKAVTVTETRRLIESDQWHHHAIIIEATESWEIECLYRKKDDK